MKILLTRTGSECPVVAHPTRVVRSNPGVPGVHGAFSVEDFPYTDDLKRTHEDAEGFLDYLEEWFPRNFWLTDGNVKRWAFDEAFDNWQDTYGVDAVLAAYFSSHGHMRSDGNFGASMGSDWADQGHYAFSHNMRIGNERANYVWWSACQSMRVRDGHDPARTWSPASLGFRMMFGYETVSVDDGDYGEDFWDEWNEGKSLGTAFLDASWGISSDQIPVAVAVGATRDEATSRVFNERMLEWGHVSDDWWCWRWYEKANPARRPPNSRLPSEPLIAVLRRTQVDGRYVRAILQRHRLDLPLPRQVTANVNGVFYIKHNDLRLSVRADGTYEVEYRPPNLKNRHALGEKDAIRIAEGFIREEKLDQNMELTFDHIRYSKVGGAAKARLQAVEPHTLEATVEFAQIVNGIPVISQKRGRVRISIDNDGRITRLQNDAREIAGLTKRPKGTVPGPDGVLSMHELDVYRRLLAQGWERRSRVRKAMGKEPSELRLVPGTDEIGYEVVGDEMAVYARGLVEIAMPGGLRKRYYVSQPIVR